MSNLFKKILGGKKAAPVEEEKETTLMMPDQDELQRAHRRKIAGRKGGRASTILTTPGNRLGP